MTINDELKVTVALKDIAKDVAKGSVSGSASGAGSGSATAIPAETITRVAALPCWQGQVSMVPLDGGITNVNLKVSDGERDYVVRLGNDIPEHGVLRFNELAISRAAHKAGLSPAVHHSQDGVLVLEFINSSALIESDLRDAKTLAEVTKMIRRVHTEMPQHVRGPVLSFWVFHVLRDYSGFLREHGSSHRPLLDGLAAEAATLEAVVGDVTLVLGHNDLLPANILRDKERFWLIDWEYGGFNSPLFDLGGLASNASLDYYAESFMLETYLGGVPTYEFLQRYTAMKCASLLRETLWSMVSQIASDIDFDYASYTAENLARYRQAFADFTSSRGNT